MAQIELLATSFPNEFMHKELVAMAHAKNHELRNGRG